LSVDQSGNVLTTTFIQQGWIKLIKLISIDDLNNLTDPKLLTSSINQVAHF